MSTATLTCPACGTGAEKRVQMPRYAYTDLYTCPGCGLTIPREELVIEKNLNILRGGALPGTPGGPPAPPAFGLIATLHGLGALGDGLDSTYEEASGVDGTLRAPASPASLESLAVVPVSISYLRFFARVSWFTSGVGPDDAQVWLIWQVGAGTTVNSDQTFPPGGVGVFSQIEGSVTAETDITLDPDGNPWTVASINDLRVGGAAFVQDNGSGETTTLQVADTWVEVWGYA